MQYADVETRLTCGTVSKFFLERIFTKEASRLKIDSSNDITPYAQVMRYYKNECYYFYKKIPFLPFDNFYKKDHFSNEWLTTVSKTKGRLEELLQGRTDATFLIPEEDPKTVIQAIWRHFMLPNETSSALLLQLPKEILMKSIFNHILISRNKEAQLLIRAGAKPVDQDVRDILRKDWCNDKTYTFLHKGIEITPDIFLNVLRNKKLNKSFPALLDQLHCSQNPEIGVHHLHQAIKAHRSPAILNLLLSTMPIELNSESVKLAIENKYCGSVIGNLLMRTRNDELMPCFEALIKSRTYQEIVHKEFTEYLAKHEGILDLSGIELHEVIRDYSPEVTLLLIEKGIRIDFKAVNLALQLQLPSDVVEMLLEKMEGLLLHKKRLLKIAKDSGYPVDLILKIDAKPTLHSSCIVS